MTELDELVEHREARIPCAIVTQSISIDFATPREV